MLFEVQEKSKQLDPSEMQPCVGPSDNTLGAVGPIFIGHALINSGQFGKTHLLKPYHETRSSAHSTPILTQNLGLT